MNAERDRILASGGPNNNAIQRNGAISAAYAQYAQRNSGNEWSGIASIVSRQARCAMEHARDSMGPVNYDDDYYHRQLPEMQRHMPLFPPEVPTPGPVALGAMGRTARSPRPIRRFSGTSTPSFDSTKSTAPTPSTGVRPADPADG